MSAKGGGGSFIMDNSPTSYLKNNIFTDMFAKGGGGSFIMDNSPTSYLKINKQIVSKWPLRGEGGGEFLIFLQLLNIEYH